MQENAPVRKHVQSVGGSCSSFSQGCVAPPSKRRAHTMGQVDQWIRVFREGRLGKPHFGQSRVQHSSGRLFVVAEWETSWSTGQNGLKCWWEGAELAFFRKKMGESARQEACQTRDDYTSYRWSRTTSAEEGATPSQQRLSRRDSAKALAAAHAGSVFHLLIHALLIASLKSSGSSHTLASASKWRKVRASPDHLPPTSQASTTKRALP